MSLGESLRRAARFLAGWSAGAALIGGFAIVARVRARPTRDVDFVIAVPNAQWLVDHAEREGYELPEDLDEWLAGGLLPLHDPEDAGFRVDLLFADDDFLQDVIRRATVVSLGDVQFPTATLEDLVLLKLLANRPIDIDDVLAIKDAFIGELDFDYLATQAAAIGVVDALGFHFDQ